jgi:hypothetical protein
MQDLIEAAGEQSVSHHLESGIRNCQSYCPAAAEKHTRAAIRRRDPNIKDGVAKT